MASPILVGPSRFGPTFSSRTAPPSDRPPSDCPPPDRPKFHAFFSFSHPPFSFFLSLSGCLLVSFCLSLEVFLVEFWSCFGRSGPSNVLVFALGLSCETPAACRNFGPPTLRAPTFSVFFLSPPFGLPPFLCLGLHPFGPSPWSPSHSSPYPSPPPPHPRKCPKLTVAKVGRGQSRWRPKFATTHDQHLSFVCARIWADFFLYFCAWFISDSVDNPEMQQIGVTWKAFLFFSEKEHEAQEHRHAQTLTTVSQARRGGKKSASASNVTGKSPSAPQTLPPSHLLSLFSSLAQQPWIRSGTCLGQSSNEAPRFFRLQGPPPPPATPPNAPGCGGGERVLGRSVPSDDSK